MQTFGILPPALPTCLLYLSCYLRSMGYKSIICVGTDVSRTLNLELKEWPVVFFLALITEKRQPLIQISHKVKEYVGTAHYCINLHFKQIETISYCYITNCPKVQCFETICIFYCSENHGSAGFTGPSHAAVVSCRLGWQLCWSCLTALPGSGRGYL